MTHRIYVDGVLRERRKDPLSMKDITTIERAYNARMKGTTQESYYKGFRRVEHIKYVFETGQRNSL